jgi:hypothetical protein
MKNKITQSKSYFKRVDAQADLKMMILNLSDDED